MSTKTILWIVAGICTVIGGLACAGTLRQLISRQRSKSWSVAPGRITMSGITTEVQTETDGDNGPRQTTMYGVNLAYTYAVGGNDLTGTRVDWVDGIKTSYPGPARKLVEKYPVGQLVNVYYDPADPATAMLEPWRMRGILFLGLFALVFSSASMLLIWVAQHEP